MSIEIAQNKAYTALFGVPTQDFFDFITALFNNSPIADFNHDSFVNSQDFFDFLTAFFTGC